MPGGVELGNDAARAFRRLRGAPRERIDRAITALAVDPRRPGKTINAIEGRHDRFLRLRAGDHRIPYEVDDVRHVVLTEGIVPPKALDKWLRSKR